MAIKTYAVYARPDDLQAEKAIFIAQRFSWAAFFFNVFWAFAKRLWIVGFLTLAAYLLMPLLPENWRMVAGFVPPLVLGSFAPDLQAWSLRRRGLVERGLTTGHNLSEAEVRFYAQTEAAPLVVVSPIAVAPTPASFDEALSGGLA